MATWVAAVIAVWALTATLLTLLLSRSLRALGTWGADGDAGLGTRRSVESGVDRLQPHVQRGS